MMILYIEDWKILASRGKDDPKFLPKAERKKVKKGTYIMKDWKPKPLYRYDEVVENWENNIFTVR